MFRKKKEYLVLTESHILRYKSQSKAADAFKSIPHPVGRTPTVRHGSMQSVGSQSDLQTLSDHSGDKDGRVPMRQVVAVHRLDDGKPYFAIEVCYLDDESGQASAMTMQFNNPEERDMWIRSIRGAARDTRAKGHAPISASNIENAARIVERENDYDPSNCAIFKVVQRQLSSKSSGRSSSDDLQKVASHVCFLAIGVHKVHVVQLVKAVARSSSPSLNPAASQITHGILTLTAVKVNKEDDSFDLTFRQPMQRQKTLHLASSMAYDIAARLHFAENYLRPECGHRLFKFVAPAEVEDLLEPAIASDEEHSCLDRTLIAYCVAYGVNPSNVRYTINYDCEDAPRFELLPPADARRLEYGPIELLAIMRALRYNESFNGMSFAGIPLDSLNGLHDNYGHEHVCSRTKRGTPIRLTPEELGRSCLLVQEIRALAATSKKLRRMDFSQCVTTKPVAPLAPLESVGEDDAVRPKDIGCGIVEALFPLCKHQTTNVDWICLNGINLSDTDLDYLVGAAVEKMCHFRAIELNRCGLNDRSMGLILDALRAQDNTLEALEIAGNNARINPVTFDGQLGMFGFIRKLNLSYVSRTSGHEPLLEAETLLIWRLQELRLSGTSLNSASIDAIATYLAHPQSTSLHELYIDHAYLSGADIATLLHSMSREAHESRDLHLDISQNNLTKGLEQITQAIADGLAPSHLTMRAVEYREESLFRKVLAALTVNKTIRYLDMSQTALPGDAGEDTCRALERLLAENDSLLELDLSGEDSRLATSKFGHGINQALAGLKRNTALQTFRIEKQHLGLQGSSTLADVLKDNRTLRELHCGNNGIPLQGLTDLINSLVDNTTLIYLPTMDDGRAAAFKAAEATMKGMSELEPTSPTFPKPSPLGGGSALKRGMASVRRTASRTSSAYTPSLSSLPSYGRSNSSPDSRLSTPNSLGVQPRTRQNSMSPMVAPVGFTVQDIQVTHCVLSEQWDRQVARLGQYLERNWCLLNGLPVDAAVEDDLAGRPDSVGSITKVLQQVKYDTTPRAEKPLYFDSPSQNAEEDGEPANDPHDSAGPLDEKQATSFKQFILESGPCTPDSEDAYVEARMKQLRLDADMDDLSEPRTPTQNGFSTTAIPHEKQMQIHTTPD
ncbi:RNI-like protein [Teratosphaeria nubilosa]|uniref:RNI-like protein n=1 Tax=Teratosphaeria nubilosa TaxID=161662 RepID=A0A6G1LKL7_9PEZI|nr:RNI-like protein [Teratosphaeria nubilosa]